MLKRNSIGILLFYLSFFTLTLNPVCAQEDLGLSYASDRGIDINDDGIFEYLEIQVEANINDPGVYILECTNFVDNEGTLIQLGISRTLNLNAGEQVITIRFDGREVYNTGSILSNISRIDLIKNDFSIGDFMDDVPLTKVYEYSEFISPENYKVGVGGGDWLRYMVNNLWESTNPDLSPSANPLVGINISVEDVVDKQVILVINYVYNEGGSEESINGYLEKGSKVFPFIAPSGLSEGESFGLFEKITVNETGSIEALGQERDYYHYIDEQIYQSQTEELSLTESYYWDKETGILLRGWLNLTSTIFVDDYVTRNNVSLELELSNLILKDTSLELEAPEATTLGNEVTVTVLLKDYDDEPVPNKQIYFKVEGMDIGTSKTNETGHARFSYEPNESGSRRLDAIFNSGEGYLGSTSSITLEVESDPSERNQSLMIATPLIIILISSGVLILRKVQIL